MKTMPLNRNFLLFGKHMLKGTICNNVFMISIIDLCIAQDL
jgi:hypothetical protein